MPLNATCHHPFVVELCPEDPDLHAKLTVRIWLTHDNRNSAASDSCCWKNRKLSDSSVGIKSERSTPVDRDTGTYSGLVTRLCLIGVKPNTDSIVMAFSSRTSAFAVQSGPSFGLSGSFRHGCLSN
jgi:hypothetical protein